MNPRDERNYLADVVKYLFASGKLRDRTAAGHIARLGASLTSAGRDDGSILLQEYWALLYEARGNIARAIPHREREIELIDQLFEIGGPIESVIPEHSINNAYLARELRILHSHYIAQGQRRKAAALLRRIRKLE
jgi:hypothetical protein